MLEVAIWCQRLGRAEQLVPTPKRWWGVPGGEALPVRRHPRLKADGLGTAQLIRPGVIARKRERRVEIDLGQRPVGT